MTALPWETYSMEADDMKQRDLYAELAEGFDALFTARTASGRVQAPELPQLRKPPHPQPRHGDGADPADHHRRHRAEGRGHDAGLEFAQLVGRADE
jgi:hypothetical protein